MSMDGAGLEPDPDTEFGIYNCSEFYTDFLSPLSSEVRKDTLNLIHELNKPDASPESAAELYTQMLLRIERELGSEHIVCEVVIRHMAERLRKFGLIEEAVELITDRMERIKFEDLGSLLEVSRVYSLSGEYNKAAEWNKKLRLLAERSENPVLLSLALVKEACTEWHLQNPDESKRKIRLCLETLEDCDEAWKTCTFPFSENTLRLIDLYKTLGYIYRFYGEDQHLSAKYNIMALKIVEKDERAVVHQFKLQARIASDFLRSHSTTSTKKYAMEAYKNILLMSKNDIYMINHSLTVLYALSHVALPLQKVMKDRYVLEVWKETYSLGEKYLGENHPAVARIAADTAYYSNQLRDYGTRESYTEKAEAALEFCLSSGDTDFIKTYVRELSDAWSILGRVYQKRDFKNSERCFKEALSMNTRVYGCNHPRLSYLHKLLGHLYKQYQMYNEALINFRKCKKINE